MAKEVKICAQVQDNIVRMVREGSKQELLDLCQQFFFNVDALKKLYWDTDLEKHFKFAYSFISERAMSLIARNTQAHASQSSLRQPVSGRKRRGKPSFTRRSLQLRALT